MMRAARDRSRAGRARLRLVGAALVLAGAVAAGSIPDRASAQLRAGPQVSFATDVFGGTIGIGPRVELGLPAFPVRLAASGDYFFPDCQGCRYWEGNVNVLVSLPLMPIPFFRFFGGGWHLQSIKANQFEEATRARGFNAVGGMNADNWNAELRYEILKDIKDQLVISFAFFLL